MPICVYRCLMKNNDFKESTPIFTKRLTDRRVEINSTVRLSCQVNGLPVPLISWYKDGEPIDLTSAGNYCTRQSICRKTYRFKYKSIIIRVIIICRPYEIVWRHSSFFYFGIDRGEIRRQRRVLGNRFKSDWNGIHSMRVGGDQQKPYRSVGSGIRIQLTVELRSDKLDNFRCSDQRIPSR